MSEHLSPQHFDLYRQRRMTPTELLAFDDHLADCESCCRRLREALPAQAALAKLQAHLHAVSEAIEPVPSVAAAKAAPTSLRTKLATALRLSSVRGRLREWLALPLQFRLASAVALIVLLILGVTLWLQPGKHKPEEVAHITPTPFISPAPMPPSPTPSPNALALLTLNDGNGQVTLDTQGKVTGLEALSSVDQQRVKAALTTQKIATPNVLKELRSPSGAVMGNSTGASFALLNPVGKIVISNRPTLRWQPLNGAASYQVTITDPKTNYQEIGVSPTLSNTEWKVNRPLTRGRVYTWQVTARTDSGEVKAPAANAPEAKFRVMERAKVDDLARAEKAYAGRHLTLGLLYAQAGLLDEAEREFQALVKANPESVVAKNLLRDVRAKRRAR